MADPAYEAVNDQEFGGDHTAAEIARTNRRRVEGNKLVHPPFPYQQYIRSPQFRAWRATHLGQQFDA